MMLVPMLHSRRAGLHYTERQFINKMFSAILEKVERLERENAELKSRLDQLGKDAADRLDKLEKGSDVVDRLGHHVCVGISIADGKPVFKRPRSCDFCQHSNGNTNGNINNCGHCNGNQCPLNLVQRLTNGLRVFFVDSLRFFPVFKDLGFELNGIGGVSMCIDLFDRIDERFLDSVVINANELSPELHSEWSPKWELRKIRNEIMIDWVGERIFEKADDIHLFRETFLKYGVQLLFNGKPID